MPRTLVGSNYDAIVYFGVNNDLLTDDSQTKIVNEAALTTLKGDIFIYLD